MEKMRRYGAFVLVGVVMAAIAGYLALFRGRPALSLRRELPARTVELTYRFTVCEVPSEATQILAWLPVPLSTQHQKLEFTRAAGEWPQAVVEEPEYGNRFIRLDLSDRPAGGTCEPTVTAVFRVRRQSVRLSGRASHMSPVLEASLARFLAPDLLVPIDGKVADEARKVAGDEKDPLRRARRLYDHIVSSMMYDKSGQGWGRGDAVRACTIRTGNCTDFHSLLIAEARSLGIPARLIMGLPLPQNVSEGTIPGYHCWAELYVEGRGWMPMDASEASKFPERKEELFGGLDENRVAFTVGRDIRIPGARSGALNYFVYPYVEIDGKPHERVETSFSFRDVQRTERRVAEPPAS